MRCYHCDQPLTPGEHFCPHCGALTEAPQQAPQAQQAVCPACRAAVPPGSSFCPVCGAAFRAGAVPPMPVGPVPQPAQGGFGGLNGWGGVPNWGKVALGGVGGLMLGSLLGGHHGGLGGFGGDDRDGGWGGSDRDGGWGDDGGGWGGDGGGSDGGD